MTKGEPDLAGLKVFVVEDESLIIMLMEDTLAEIGCEVVDTASRLDEAIQKASVLSFNLAILDVNLNGQQTFPVAEAISKRNLPFVWATGYGGGGIPKSAVEAPVLSKPFQQKDLERAIRAALSRGV